MLKTFAATALLAAASLGLAACNNTPDTAADDTAMDTGATPEPMPSDTLSPMPSDTMSPSPSDTMSPSPSDTMAPSPTGTATTTY